MKIALVGYSKHSNYPAFSLTPDVQVWSLNHSHEMDLPRVDAWFDMHELELIQDPHFLTPEKQAAHLQFLYSEHDYQIYTLRERPEIPAGVRYPIEQALVMAGQYRKFTSSFCYMIAMALLQGADWIGVYGFDLDAGTEYEYQREDALKWIGYAEGLGVTVDIPPESGLRNDNVILYGYEGIPMVGRQVMEVHRTQYERKQAEAETEMHRWEGILAERRKRGESRRQLSEAEEMVAGWMRTAAMNEGAAQSIWFLLQTCDMNEVDPVLAAPELQRQEVAECV